MVRITVRAAMVCGQCRFYPASDAAKELAALTKTHTFTFTMLLHARRMGATLSITGDSWQPAKGTAEYLQFEQLFGG
jgi:hypothetical protein